MNEQLIRKLFPGATASLFAANADDSELPNKSERRKGEVNERSPELERNPRARTLGKSKAKDGNSKRLLVRVTSIRRRLIDEDNLCEKYVVDCCRYAGLLPGDGPGETKIEVGQRKAGKEEAEGTLIEIFDTAL